MTNSHTYRRYFILFVAASLLRQSLVWADMGMVAPTAPVCVRTPGDNSYSVIKDISAETAKLQKLKVDLSAFADDMRDFKTDLSERTTAQPTYNRTANELANKIAAARDQMLAVLSSPRLSLSQVDIARDVVSSYFDMVSIMFTLSLNDNPYMPISISALQTQYAVRIPIDVWMNLNIDRSVAFTDVIGEDKDSVAVSLSVEYILAALESAAARTRSIRATPMKAEFELTRCKLFSVITQQYFTQEFDRGMNIDNIALPIAPSTPACLGLSLGELQNIIRKNLKAPSEAVYRNHLAEETLQADNVIAKDFNSFISKNRVSYPALIPTLISPPAIVQVHDGFTPDAEGVKVRNWFVEATNSADRYTPYYAPLMTITKTPAFQQLIDELIQSCPNSLESSNAATEQEKTKTTQDIAQFKENTVLVERVLGLQLIEVFNYYSGKLERKDPDKLKASVIKLLTYKKFLDAQAIVRLFYRSKFAAVTPKENELVDSLNDRLYEIAKHSVEQALSNSNVQNWLTTVVAAARSASSDAMPMVDFEGHSLSAVDAAVLKVAEKAAFYADPNSDKTKIMFLPLSMGFTRAELLNRVISPINNARLGVVAPQTPDGMREVWKAYAPRIDAETKAAGASCDAPNKLDITEVFLKTWTHQDMSEKWKAQSQCFLLHQVATLMGLNLPQSPANLAEAMGEVRKAAADDSDLNNILRIYREDLVSKEVSDYRFLKMRYTNNPKDTKAPFVYEVAANKEKSLDDRLKAIHWAIWSSSARITDVAKKYLVAKSLDGYDNFLAENDSVLNLLKDTPAIYKSMVARISMTQENLRIAKGDMIKDEAFKDFNTFFWLFAGMSASRYFMPYLPIVGRTKLISSSTALIGKASIRLKSVSDGFFGMVPIVLQNALDLKMQSSRIGDNRLKISQLANAYWLQGLKADSDFLVTDDAYATGIQSYEGKISESHWSIGSDLFGLLIVGTIIGFVKYRSIVAKDPGMRVIPLTPGYRAERLRKAVASGDTSKIENAQKAIQNDFIRDRIRLQFASNSLRLGKTDNLTIKQLQTKLNEVRFGADSTPQQIADAELGYREYVQIIGSRVEMMENESDYLEQYATAALGRYGRVSDLWDIHKEYSDMILKRGGQP